METNEEIEVIVKKKKGDILTFSEKFSVLAFFMLGIYILVRAVYWGVSHNNIINDSQLYRALAEIVPLNIWAIPFGLSGLLLIWASALLIKQTTSKKFDYVLIFGGVLAFICYMLLALASVSNGINWMTPATNCVLSILFLSMAYLGVESLWKKKQEKKN